MKVKKNKNGDLVLIFGQGENYPAEFIKFFRENKIRGGFFFGLGAFIDPEIAYYDHKKKKYLVKKLKGVFEVLSLVGNVAETTSRLVVHSHVVLGKRNFTVLGGHVMGAKVGATLEIHFVKTGILERKVDSTGFGILI